MASPVTGVLSGAVFGAALVAAGVYQPAVIIGQLKLENWHMLQTFLAAAAGSTLIVTALGKQGVVPLKPRTPSSLGLLTRYDGNLAGGALLGVGMALSGSCPGTVLAQVGAGTPSGLHALDGALLAGVAYAVVVRPWQCRRGTNTETCPVEDAAAEAERRHTLHGWLAAPRPAAAAGFAALTASIAAGLAVFAAPSRYAVMVPPLAGGVLIALAQLFSALSRGTLLGASTGYEEAGDLFWWLVVGGASAEKRPRAYRNLLFGVGVVLGALALSVAVPELAVTGAGGGVRPSAALATVGGFLMVMGSRIAGGCTSGHGISGMSLLSLASFVTIGTAFGVGALVAPLVY